ncbi:universal stress protein [Cyanobacterium sp. Dongsha4]|uniref:universal stress protein n=1 Tax=Cyanobacterium sp. DS4 TaxID=2878255 RepID=UPI000F10FEEA|nr:universal stress protein [Cyanobacterium sp. Dongsha4]RMD71522.1 MAG: universal stress protein [Cyanobacteria bacterium J149]WVL00381.1 universal stress protein [Cyanobacterium sp. Dongsha4]
MYDKILVSLDRSPIAQSVFETALYLGKNCHSQLNFLHVLSQETTETPLSFAPYSFTYDTEIIKELQHQWEKYKQESIEMLQYWTNQAKDQGLKAEFKQIYGHPGTIICQEAQEWGANLIVMGRRGHSTVSELLLGSVSSYVIHRSHCAVHLVQF